MPRKGTISHNSKARGDQEWYLATRTDVVGFYLFDALMDANSPMGDYTIIESLDRTRLQAAGDKQTAASWAKRLKLTSWTYVRI
jgi:hypothetical protein